MHSSIFGCRGSAVPSNRRHGIVIVDRTSEKSSRSVVRARRAVRSFVTILDRIAGPRCVPKMGGEILEVFVNAN